MAEPGRGQPSGGRMAGRPDTVRTDGASNVLIDPVHRVSTSGGSTPSVPTPAFASPHFRRKLLAEGVYGAIATQSGAATSDAGIVDLGEFTPVFDTFLTPRAGADLRAAAERATGRPPSLVVTSHYHNDHTRGNQHFAGASIAASRRTTELLGTKGEEELSSDRTETAQALELYLTGQRARDPDYDFWVSY